MRTAIFLGAGASAADGAPVQSNLFRDFFKSTHGAPVPADMRGALNGFFAQMFDIDVQSADLDSIEFPTFEEALGVLDLAERRKESLRNLHLDVFSSDVHGIRYVRQCLVMLMAKVIQDALSRNNNAHSRLTKNLVRAGLLGDTTFLSTNYDILIDNALTSLYPETALEYGVEFTNFADGSWDRPHQQAVHLYKVHGSLNWLYCATCNSLTLTPREKGITMRLLASNEDANCRSCNSMIVPIIVPPTYFKDMSNIYLSTVWSKAEQALVRADHVVFCGYSFPDSDIHIKYMVKRAQTNRQGRLHVSVINNHARKKPGVADEERARYRRFLGASVDYTDLSFEDFAKDPVAHLATAGGNGR
jgi:NAD-dependent SIR2 family protein deacetylase